MLARVVRGETMDLFERGCVRVQEDDGMVFAVTDSGCECGETGCWHEDIVQKLESRDRSVGKIAKSAFHKELRTGNIGMAIAFAEICEKYRPGEAKRYMRKVLFEETRNLHLLEEFYSTSSRDWKKLVRLFCRSRKDWELEWNMGWCSRPWVKALCEHEMLPEGLPPKISWPDDVYRFAMDCIDAGEFEKLYLYVVCSDLGAGPYPDEKKKLRDALCDAMEKSGHPNAAASKHLRTMYNDELSVAFEVVSGAWKEEANEYGEPSGDEEGAFDIPAVHDYVHDHHTAIGRARIQRAGGQFKAGEPLPGGIDLRLAGGDSGTIWRMEAFRQFGTIDVPWEAVKPDSEFAEQLNELCERWYRSWDGSPREIDW